MKIVHIATYRTGGAGSAAWRLHEALLECGVESRFISFEQDGPKDKHWYSATKYESFLVRKLNRLKSFFQEIFEEFDESILLKKQLSRKINKLKLLIDAEYISIPFSIYKLHKHPEVISSDIVHLHWVANILDYPSFFKSVKARIVWTLHDLNPLLGIFHFLLDKEKFIKEASCLEEKCLQIKKLSINEAMHPIKYIAPSSYFYNYAIKQGIKDEYIYLIPYTGIITRTHLSRAKLRQEGGWQNSDRVAMVIASDLSNYRKGMDILVEALGLCNSDFILLAVGESGSFFSNLSRVVTTGYIESYDKLFELYYQSDVLIIPSREDNLPNVMLEAFACGLPVISFASGGMKDHIINGKNGFLATENNSNALANAIDDFWQSERNIIRNDIQDYAHLHFDKYKIIDHHNSLYKMEEI